MMYHFHSVFIPKGQKHDQLWPDTLTSQLILIASSDTKKFTEIHKHYLDVSGNPADSSRNTDR